MTDRADPFEQAYEICKLQASVDGAFPELLMRHWFQASWDLCAAMIGLVYPRREIQEPIIVDNCGNFQLSFRPSSDVEIFDGYTLIMTLPPSLKRSWCDPALCCLCKPVARYTVGEDICELSPRFVQAVARVFAYIVENRGDTELDDQVLGKCGALRFLSPDLAFVM